MTVLNTCTTKIAYDTQFEAELAASRHDVSMKAYPCGRHFHLAHEDKSQNFGYGHARKYRRCPKCKVTVRRWKMSMHK